MSFLLTASDTYFTVILLGFQMLFVYITGPSLQRGATVVPGELQLSRLSVTLASYAGILWDRHAILLPHVVITVVIKNWIIG